MQRMPSLAIFAALSLCAAVAGGQCTQPAPANPCAPGGGTQVTDCGMEWQFTPMPKKLVNGVPVADAIRGVNRSRIICYEGDPRCDFDADLDNRSCTFQTKICINNSDPRLAKCTPSELTTFEVTQPKPAAPRTAADIANVATLESQAGSGGFGATVVRNGNVIFAGSPNGTANLCSNDLPLVVPMLINGTSNAPKRTVKRIRVAATNNAGAKEPDTLQLDCRPSTCGDGVVQADHETCDQGNRVNGDGCNQACQIETGPTNTPGPSSTPTVPAPTGTPTVPGPTNTPTTPPTASPTRTPTLAAPTSTPTNPPPTGTATATQGPDRLFQIAPAGGSDGNCRGTCTGGLNPGASCGAAADCRVCSGGSRAGLSCSANSECPGSTCPAGGTCSAPRTCVGGPRNSLTCANSGDCNGCAPNNICTGAGAPLACCTGTDSGSCPVSGSCALVQNSLFPIRVPLNGVCVPRAYIDRGCTTDAECAPLGKTCQFSSLTLQVGSADGNNEIPITIQQSDVKVMPARVGSIGTVCVSAASNGGGVIDCDGGRANLNLLSLKDHNTTPGNAGNSGSAAGLVDDPSCTNTAVQPDGSISRACLEGTKQCDGGVNEGALCMVDGDCPGSTCSPCTTQPQALHGVCNSPTVAVQSGTFGAGDASIALPLALTILSTGPSILPPAPTPSPTPPADWGPDRLPCTADDTVQSSGAVVVTLSTGTNSVLIYDANNTSGLRLGVSSETTCTSDGNCPLGESCRNSSNDLACNTGSCRCVILCGASPCLGQTTGTPLSCSNLSAGNLTGLTFGGGFPGLDTQASDIATLFQFQAK